MTRKQFRQSCQSDINQMVAVGEAKATAESNGTTSAPTAADIESALRELTNLARPAAILLKRLIDAGCAKGILDPNGPTAHYWMNLSLSVDRADNLLTLLDESKHVEETGGAS